MENTLIFLLPVIALLLLSIVILIRKLIFVFGKSLKITETQSQDLSKLFTALDNIEDVITGNSQSRKDRQEYTSSAKFGHPDRSLKDYIYSARSRQQNIATLLVELSWFRESWEYNHRSALRGLDERRFDFEIERLRAQGVEGNLDSLIKAHREYPEKFRRFHERKEKRRRRYSQD